MVEAAQARTAPIQRLADAVAGRFAYGVMGASLATFLFWSTAGTSMFPQVGGGCVHTHITSRGLALTATDCAHQEALHS